MEIYWFLAIFPLWQYLKKIHGHILPSDANISARGRQLPNAAEVFFQRHRPNVSRSSRGGPSRMMEVAPLVAPKPSRYLALVAALAYPALAGCFQRWDSPSNLSARYARMVPMIGPSCPWTHLQSGQSHAPSKSKHHCSELDASAYQRSLMRQRKHMRLLSKRS